MNTSNIKLPKKNAGKLLKEIYEKNRKNSKASPELLNFLNDQIIEEQNSENQNKKSANNRDLDI